MNKLFIIDFSGTRDEEVIEAADSSFISADRRKELESIKIQRGFGDKFKEKLGAELMIAAAMKSYGLEYIPPAYERNDNGKPWCGNAFFSVSHTKNAACSIIGKVPVGIDIEAKRTIRAEVSKKILSETEREEYESAKSKNDFLLRHWTAKESYLKRDGRGINVDMRRVNLDEKNLIIEEQYGQTAVNNAPVAIINSSEVKEAYNSLSDCFIAVSGVGRKRIEIMVFTGFSEVIKFLESI